MDVMVDIETLSTEPNAVVLSVGAVKFDAKNFVEPTEKIHWRLDINQQVEMGRDVSNDTLTWWAQQDREVREEVFAEEGRILPVDFMKEFNRYCNGIQDIWCQGPQFDMVILESLYRSFDHHWNWQYYQIRDSRTLMQVVKKVSGMKDPRKGMQQLLHNAAEDSYWQAKAVQIIMDKIEVTQ